MDQRSTISAARRMSLFPSLKVNHTALSQSGNFATPPNTTHLETIEIEDSDTDPHRKQKDKLIDTPLGNEPPKLPEKVAAISCQHPQEPALKCVTAIPSAPLPNKALVPFPLFKQLHKPSPKSSDTATVYYGL